MKASEAPEKIYLNKHPFTGELHDKWLLNKWDDSDIEYTRTDAVIEKACDAYCKVCDTQECEGICECIWVQRFRKQLMK